MEQKISRKRKLSIEDDDNKSANDGQKPIKIKINENDLGLMSLSDEVLLEICQYLDHNTLLSLGSTCSKFKNFVLDKDFWIDVRFLSVPLMRNYIQKNIIKNVTAETKSLTFRGMLSYYPEEKWKNLTITKDMLDKIQERAPNLEHLKIIESTVDICELKNIKAFPKTLKSLEFVKSESISGRQHITGFFTQFDTHMLHLEKLVLEECSWFDVHDFMVFSKLPKLKYLSLRGCTNLKDCVPYCSVSARFGFKCLEVLDVRDTPISDSDIQCFNVTKTLRELYLDCPTYLRNQNPNAPNPPPNVNPLQQRNNENMLRQNNERFNNANNIIVVFPFMNHGQQGNNPDNNQQAADGDDAAANGRDDGVGPAPRQMHIDINLQRNDDGESSDSDDDDEGGGANRPMIHVNICNRNNVSFSFNSYQNPPLSLISDRAMLSFGIPRYNLPNMIFIRTEARSPDSFLEILHIRNYKLVTDETLRHLSSCSPNLKEIDVTGTAVTLNGIKEFKLVKSNCKVISNFGKELAEEDEEEAVV